MRLTGHTSRTIFDRDPIIHEQERLKAEDELVASLARQAQAPRTDNPCDLSGIHVSHSYLYIYTWLSDHDSLVVPLFLNGNPRDHPSRPRTGLSQIS